MNKRIPAICALLLFFSLQGFSQNTASALQGIVAKLKTITGENIIERSYLHFDKPYYAVGDTMYFKAYVTLGERHNLSSLSGIEYVDLISPNHAILSSVKLQIIDGVGWGDFALPDSLVSGNYQVRAYTHYMENDKDYFFTQTIPIGSIHSPTLSQSKSSSSVSGTKVSARVDPDIQFFPEGGELVTGILSKVGFKALGPNGLGSSVKGIILDNTNVQVASFASIHLGMGIFTLTPVEGKTYKARITFANGFKSTVDLPKAQAKGIVLAVIDSLNKISVEIHCNKVYLQENLNKEINLVLYGGGFASSVNTKLDSRVLSLDIPNSKFSSGIVQVTLFSQSAEPLSERLIFILNPDLLDLSVKSDKTTYAQREKVQLELNSRDAAGSPSAGHFSVSVNNENTLPTNENAQSTILTSLLLTQELKGYVEEPGYYLKKATEKNYYELDALMLTQGYRRFIWKKLLNESTASFTFKPEKTLQITGVEKTSTGQPVADRDILLRPSVGNSTLSQRTDGKGVFRFENLVFFNGTNFTLQSTRSTKDKSATSITVDGDQPHPAVTSLPEQTSSNLSPQMNTYLASLIRNNSTKTIALKRVVVKNNRENSQYESSNLGGSGHADQVVLADQIQGSSSLSAGLNGRLRGINFASGVPYLQSGGAVTAVGTGSLPMLVILDGAYLGAGSSIDEINPAMVSSIEVLKGNNTAIYGEAGGAGVLIITTRQGGEQIATRQSKSAFGNLTFTPTGFYKARDFYSPRYSPGPTSNLPDQRSTIFWNPELVTDKTGKASMQFLNGDNKGPHHVIVEGIDNGGNIGRQVLNYAVE